MLHFVAHIVWPSWPPLQIVEAFPWDEAPRYLLRDRDCIYGALFRRRVDSMGIEEVRIAPRSPWQTPYVERLIGSIRRDCLDHSIVLGEAHLRDRLGQPLNVNEDSHYIGALGAALFAFDEIHARRAPHAREAAS